MKNITINEFEKLLDSKLESIKTDISNIKENIKLINIDLNSIDKLLDKYN